MRKIYSFILSGIVLTAVLYASRNQIDKIDSISEFSVSSLIIISILFILVQFIFGFQLKNILSAFYIKTTFKEWFGLIAVQSMGNYLPFSGGTLSNIAYLKVHKKLPVSNYLGYLAGDTILKITIYGVVGIVILLGNWILFNQFNATLLLIIGIFFIFGLLSVILPGVRFIPENKVIRWIISLHEGWLIIRNNTKVLIICILTHILTLILISFQYYFIFKELNFQFNLYSIFILTIITNLVRVASLFPGNIGLRESVSGIVLQLFGFSFGIGVLASLMGRIISMFWIFLFGGIFSYILINNNTIHTSRRI